MDEKFTVRRFVPADAVDVQKIIHRGLREVNGKDYPAERIEEYCAFFTTEKIIEQAETAHMYVAVSDSGRILGTGTIAPFWGSETESILLTIYVLPDLIGNGIGTGIIHTLEKDEYFLRAKRIEIPSSVTAVNFYRKLGYKFRDGRGIPDEEGLVRMEKLK
ncbi:MAG: GNAT family N-acetyltransferase [Lentisphaeria bacterium]|nr:GNAT family N-acetyltransferase [Lentisphaeria bacterium]